MTAALATPPVQAVFAFYPLTNFEWMGLVDPKLTYAGVNATDKAFADKVYEGGSVTAVPVPCVFTSGLGRHPSDYVLTMSFSFQCRERSSSAPHSSSLVHQHGQLDTHPDRRYELTLRSQMMGTDTIISRLIPNNTYALRAEWSPFHRATASYPPTFLGIPELDRVVFKSQGFAMVEKLTELGVEVQHGLAVGGSHAFDFVNSTRNLAGGDWWEDVSKPAAEFVIAKLAA